MKFPGFFLLFCVGFLIFGQPLLTGLSSTGGEWIAALLGWVAFGILTGMGGGKGVVG
jgi:hypothetical protein